MNRGPRPGLLRLVEDGQLVEWPCFDGDCRRRTLHLIRRFPFWSAETADEFRALVGAAFAEAGLEVTTYEDHVVDATDRQFGLSNLAASCHNTDGGQRAWPELIKRHVGQLLAAMDEPSIELRERVQVLASTYLRVIATEALLPRMSYARQIAPGLAQVLNLDLPTTVTYLNNEQVESLGVRDLYAAGLANLRTVRADVRETLDHEGGTIEVLLGESLFVASLILILDEVVARYGYSVDPEVGVFVAIPHRSQLDFHVPRDQSAIASLKLLAGFAAAGFRDSAGPVSPDVFWWRPGGIERVSTTTIDGTHIEVGPDLTDVLNRLFAE